MIGKSEFTRLLRDASDMEESYMGFLTEFVERYFDWTGFPPEKVSTAKSLIERLRVESEAHNKVIENLLVWISGRKEDEF